MMQLAIFINKDIEFFFGKLSTLSKSGNDGTSSGKRGELCSLGHYGVMRTKTDM